jgi:hypothetical protein
MHAHICMTPSHLYAGSKVLIDFARYASMTKIASIQFFWQAATTADTNWHLVCSLLGCLRASNEMHFAAMQRMTWALATHLASRLWPSSWLIPILSGLASSSWRFRPAGGRVLGNFDQLPPRGPLRAAKCILAGEMVETPPVSGPKVRSASRRPFHSFRNFAEGPDGPSAVNFDPSTSLRALHTMPCQVI